MGNITYIDCFLKSSQSMASVNCGVLLLTKKMFSWDSLFFPLLNFVGFHKLLNSTSRLHQHDLISHSKANRSLNRTVSYGSFIRLSTIWELCMFFHFFFFPILVFFVWKASFYFWNCYSLPLQGSALEPSALLLGNDSLCVWLLYLFSMLFFQEFINLCQKSMW